MSNNIQADIEGFVERAVDDMEIEYRAERLTKHNTTDYIHETVDGCSYVIYTAEARQVAELTSYDQQSEAMAMSDGSLDKMITMGAYLYIQDLLLSEWYAREAEIDEEIEQAEIDAEYEAEQAEIDAEIELKS